MNVFSCNTSQSHRIRGWLFLFFSVAVMLTACKPRTRKTLGAPAHTEAQVTMEQSGDKVDVSVDPLPDGTVAVRCSVNQEPELDCRNGLIMQNLKPGRYTLVVTFVTGDQTIREVREIVIEGDTVTDQTPPKTPAVGGTDGQQDIRFILNLAGASQNWQNNEAAFRSKPLVFEFALDTNQTCTSQVMCSFAPDVWALCDFENKPRLELDPREISEGFQKVSVKAACDQPKIESKVLELSWFGVGDDYKPLALTKRDVNHVANYQLVKQNDCLGELTFECASAASQGGFVSCINVRENPPSGFQIRAVCTTASGAVRGPILTEQ